MNPGGSSIGGGGSSFVGLNNGESGILRKTAGMGGHHHHGHHGQDNFADLLVFGYSCKIFRDDEKARFIDQGRHLIPWMGDNQLKIDRYDARGALHDLSQHEAPIGGYGNRLDSLPPAEQRAEQLCEDERYYSLYANEVEEEIYQEEAAKRQAAAGAEIAFDYDAPPAAVADAATDGPTVGPEPQSVDDENSSDPPFVAPSNFEIPSDLDRPDTMKEHAIIEKTAKFIASQDAQMEILLRAKQAANPQFGFLSPGGRLYRYYRHVLMAIKTNQYPEEQEEEETPEGGETNGTEAESVEAVEAVPAKVVVPTIKYKPSVDCAYTQLISKITGAPILLKEDDADGGTESQDSTSMPVNSNSVNNDPSDEKSVQVKKVSGGLAGLVQYDSDSEDSGKETEDKKEKKPEVEMERRELKFNGLLPPEIFQHVIEKTATYVAKNGYSFEEALRTKNDPRFLFLRKDHEFYPFYAFRVRYLINPFEEVPKTPEKVTITRKIENGTVVETPSIGIKTVNTAPQPVPAPQTQIQATKPGGAVCFSIKSKDDLGPVALKTNVAQELGGVDEEEAADVEKKEKEKSKSPVPQEKVVEETKEDGEKADEERQRDLESSNTPPPSVIRSGESSQRTTPPLLEAPAVVTPTTPTPTPDPDAGNAGAGAGAKDQKRLEDRIKDKLASAAREKLAMISKEKQLQLERKKRASMFLTMLGKSEPKADDEQPKVDDEQPKVDDEQPKVDDEPVAPATNEWEDSPPRPVVSSSRNGLDLLKNQFSDDDDSGDDEKQRSSVRIQPRLPIIDLEPLFSSTFGTKPAESNEEEMIGRRQHPLDEKDGEGSNSSDMSIHSIPSGSDSSADDDVVLVEDDGATGKGRPSRSRTRSHSRTSSSRHKKRKHKHKSKSSKKSSKKKRSRSRSRSKSRVKSSKRKRSRSRSRSRSPSEKRDAKKKKKSKKQKSHKHHKSSRSSSSSRKKTKGEY